MLHNAMCVHSIHRVSPNITKFWESIGLFQKINFHQKSQEQKLFFQTMPKISLPLVGYFLKIFLSFPCPDIFINLDLSSNKGALLLQLIPIIGLILTDLLLYTICCENAALSGLNSLPHPLRISLECFFFKNDPLRRLTLLLLAHWEHYW